MIWGKKQVQNGCLVEADYVKNIDVYIIRSW